MYFNCSHYNREDKHFVTLFTPAVGQKGQLNNAMNLKISSFRFILTTYIPIVMFMKVAVI